MAAARGQVLRESTTRSGGQRTRQDIHLSTADHHSVGFHPWLIIQSVRWLTSTSARTNSKLSFDKWPQGGERLQLAFKPGWKSGDALYIPCDRESIVGHDCWFAQYPQLIWNPAKGISHYLEVVHELLQSRDYTCAPA